MDVREALSKWDAGEAVWSIEMGGLGPGYEQSIQILIWELVRDAEPVALDMSLAGWGEAAVTRTDNAAGGFSGAQVGVAKAVAAHFLLHGYEATLGKVESNRRILVSKFWPRAPAQGEETHNE